MGRVLQSPADYTPVCTTGLDRIAPLQSDFAKRNTKVMALSVDPIEDHREWAPDIGEVSGTPLNLPIVDGRSVFVVDPDNKLRLTLTYPKSVGRNFDEIVRVIDALQATDRVVVSLGVSTGNAAAGFNNVEEIKPDLRFADAPRPDRSQSRHEMSVMR